MCGIFSIWSKLEEFFLGVGFWGRYKSIKRHIFSSIWSCVKNETLLIRDNSSWILKNDKLISFWYDNWWSSPLILDMGNQVVVEDLFVNSFIIDHKWNFLSSNHNIPDSLQVKICNFHIPINLRPDKRIQRHSPLGELTLKYAYDFKRNLCVYKDWWRCIWSKTIMPLKSFLVWRWLLIKLSTNDQLNLHLLFSNR